MEFERQTNLSLEALKKTISREIESPSCPEFCRLPDIYQQICIRSGNIPPCLAVNEIGCMFMNSEPVEKDLAAMLADSEFSPTAFVFLNQRRDKLSPETQRAMEAFEANPVYQDEIEELKGIVLEGETHGMPPVA